jgi:hypothetical protein
MSSLDFDDAADTRVDHDIPEEGETNRDVQITSQSAESMAAGGSGEVTPVRRTPRPTGLFPKLSNIPPANQLFRS